MDTKTFDSDHKYALFQRVLAAGQGLVRAFGGGTSGLAEDAAEACKKVFGWDYMGDAQFEHGECVNCLTFMWQNRKKLVTSEANGFHFLTLPKHREPAHALWEQVVANPDIMRHSPGLHSPYVLGWFDFKNGFFVSRTPELRDAVQKMLIEFK